MIGNMADFATRNASWESWVERKYPAIESQLYALFENATGYALFRTTEFEEVGIFLPQVQKSILDVSKFRSIVHFIAFHPFQMGEALENMKCIADGNLHKDLHLFLEMNVPKTKKSKQAVVLGVQDKDLASAITSTLRISCSTSGVVDEIMRGIRCHFHKLIKGYKDFDTINKSQQSLAHHYARVKLNLSIQKFDNMITHSVSMLDQLNKDIRTLTLRIREWYSFHFPELAKLVPDTEMYVKCVKEIKDRNDMPENIKDVLKTILQDEEKVALILEASDHSMGMDIATEDIENLERFIDQVLSLMNRRNDQDRYLNSKMHLIAPNLAAVIGEPVGAQLISQAGSLTNLARLPSSTVQILGAGKSLFRSLKKKKSTAKFGSLQKKTILGEKLFAGKMSRILANKCSLASKVDCFSVNPSSHYGEELKRFIEERNELYETGKLGGSSNPNALKARKEALRARKAALRKLKKERKLQKQSKCNGITLKNGTVDSANDRIANELDVEEVESRPKRSKRKIKASVASETATDSADELPKRRTRLSRSVKS